MTFASALALAAAIFILAVSPGPGMLAVAARAMGSGFRSSLAIIAGIVLGDLIFLLLAISGLAMLAEVLGGFFTIVRILGGFYLVWLGVKLWRSASFQNERASGLKSSRTLGNFTSGLTIALSNPKVIIFYGCFLPNFLDLHSLTWAEVAATAFIVAFIVATVLAGYAMAASRARHLFSSPLAVQRLNRTAGTTMIAAGGAVVSIS